MPERPSPQVIPRSPLPATPAVTPKPAATKADAFLCDRCRAEMFRMHAVWRCPSCGYKTDCCGW
jgi:hypothetical protein